MANCHLSVVVQAFTRVHSTSWTMWNYVDQGKTRLFHAPSGGAGKEGPRDLNPQLSLLLGWYHGSRGVRTSQCARSSPPRLEAQKWSSLIRLPWRFAPDQDRSFPGSPSSPRFSWPLLAASPLLAFPKKKFAGIRCPQLWTP